MATYCVYDEHHIEHIFSAARPRLVRLCAYLTNESDAGEDLAQEVLIEAWRHLDHLRNPQAFDSWLNGIARNVSARWLRARGRDLAVRGGAANEIAMAQHPATDSDLEVALERHELATLLDRALALLPEATRTVLVQRYIAESPHVAIAAQLDMSENAVAVRLHRGKLALHKLLTSDLRDEAATLGLVTGDEWQETRIWCSWCGQHRLRGKLDDDEFALRCPLCSAEPGSFHSQFTKPMSFTSGVKGFRPVLTRFCTWMDTFFQGAIAHGQVRCQRCGHATPLYRYLPDYAPPRVRERRGLHIKCRRCGVGAYTSLDGVALNTPEGRNFWREHPRIRTLPQREVEIEGIAAILLAFESVDRRATFELAVRSDTYASIQPGGRRG